MPTTEVELGKNPRKVAAGRKGGLTTLQRYGRDQLAAWGQQGGRPRAMTYEEIRQRKRLELRYLGKEVKGPPGSLTELKRLHKLRRRSSGIPETPEAGTTQETPREQVPAGKESGRV